MATSLEELLAEEGFKGRRSIMKSGSSFRSSAESTPPKHSHDRHNSDSASSNRITTRMRKSTLSRHSSGSSDGSRGKTTMDNLKRREKLDEGSKKEYADRLESKGHVHVPERIRVDVNLLNGKSENENFEVAEEENGNFKDIYSNEAHNLWAGNDEYSNRTREEEGHSEKILNKQLFRTVSSSHNNRKSTKLLESPYEKSDRGSMKSKSFKDNHIHNFEKCSHPFAIPALDEVAIRALISILSGYMKRFLKDEEFRTMLRHDCFASLNIIGIEEEEIASKVIANLDQAIDIVERAAEESASEKDLKRASLLLSMITGLTKNGLKDEFASGVPNSKLSACAHLYLSVIYKLQKKDKGSAKHISQVFCDSPFQARTMLLPELWDCLFLPHLSHLKAWYDREADLMGNTPIRTRKLSVLEKAYNEILDSGTYQIAVYYKDWLDGGAENPSMPSIPIPSVSFHGVYQESSVCHSSGLISPEDSPSPQPMVSKKLYDAVFGNSRKDRLREGVDDGKLDKIENGLRSSDGSTNLKHTEAHYPVAVQNTDQDIEEDSNESVQFDTSLEKGVVSTDEWKMYEVNLPSEKYSNDEISTNEGRKTTRDFQMLPAQPRAKATEFALKMLAKSIFQSYDTNSSLDLTLSSASNSSEASISSSVAKPLKVRSSSDELNESYEYFEERSFLLCIPQDFICPLTGQLFEDPVTLETGQTFEQRAIKAWFGQGNRTCPVTNKNLDNFSVPHINFVLKRVIYNWKLDRCAHLLEFASQIVENSNEDKIKYNDEMAILVFKLLLTSFGKDEGKNNAKHLISIGSLRFLLQRVEFGNLEEKTRVMALLLCYIEADARCRDHIARGINKTCRLELLHSKEVKSVTNVVLLLSKLICLKRTKDVTLFLRDFLNEEGQKNTMHVLLLHLQSSHPEQKPLVAVLLLHLDLTVCSLTEDVEYQQHSLYKEEAVDALIMALDGSLNDEKVRENCCKAILILGGSFSFCGKLLIDLWMLKQAGFISTSEVNSLENQEGGVIDSTILSDEEEPPSMEWLSNLAASLLYCGKKSFVEIISKCLRSGNSDLVGVCLTTVAWLSFALSSLSDSEFQLSAFSALFCQLKHNLENGLLVEHKILASMSLLNFSKISECRLLMMTMGKEIAAPLRSISEFTWTAKQLYTIICGEDT